MASSAAQGPEGHQAELQRFSTCVSTDDHARCLHCVPMPNRHTLAPISTTKLVMRHPHLMNVDVLRQPFKLAVLLHHCQVGPLERFCDACPAETMAQAFPTLLAGLRAERVAHVLAPMLNSVEHHHCMIDQMKAVDPRRTVQILNSVDGFKTLDIIMRAPSSVLASITQGIDNTRVPAMLVTMQESRKLVRLFKHIHHPERLAALVNQVEPEVHVWFVQGVPELRLARILDLFGPDDYELKGSLVLLMQFLEGEKRLVSNIVAPFMCLAEPLTLVRLVQNVPAHKLMENLRRVGPTKVADICEHTNVDLIIRLFNGPLESLMNYAAHSTADLVQTSAGAWINKAVSDSLNDACKSIDERVNRGKVSRGAEQGEAYQFGDFSRGLMAAASEATWRSALEGVMGGNLADPAVAGGAVPVQSRNPAQTVPKHTRFE